MIQNIKNARTLGEQNEMFFGVINNLNNPAVIRNSTSDIQKRADSITAFLKDILSPDGQVPDGKLSFSYNFNGQIFNKIFSTKKINPVKKSTVSLGELSAYVGSISNVYISLPIYYNTITYEHTERNISNLYCIGLDIDDFALSEFNTDEQKVAAIFENYPFFKYLVPNKIVNSGNKGFHVYYLFDTDLYNNLIKVKEVSKAMSLIVGADITKTSANNKLRLPFTYNISLDANQSKEPVLSTVIYDNVNRYNFYEFLNQVKSFVDSSIRVKFYDKGFVTMDNDTYNNMTEEEPLFIENNIDLNETEPMGKYILNNTNFFEKCIKSNKKHGEGFLQTKKKNSRTNKEKPAKQELDKAYNIKTYYYRLSFALKDLLTDTNGRLTGVRNNYIHILAVTYKQLNMAEDTILSKLQYANSQFSTPLPDCQIKAIWRCVNRHKYRISASSIKEMLELDDDYLRRYNIAVTKEERKARKQKQNKKLAAARKKMRNTKAKKYKQISLVRKYLKKSIAKKQIMQMLNISRSTLYRIIKILGIAKNKFRYDYASLKKKIKAYIHKVAQKIKARLNAIKSVSRLDQALHIKETHVILC